MGRRSSVWSRKGRGFWTTLHKHQIFLGMNRKEAKRELDRLLKQDKPIHIGEFSVAQLVELFLADCAKRVEANKLSTHILASYRSFLNRWAEACWRVRPEQLRVLHLDAWIESHDTWNSTTANTATRRVKAWAKWCKRKGYVDYNHFSDAIAPAQLTRDAADPADLLKMEQAITCPRFLDFFQVLYDTGARPGELKSITAHSVDFGLSTAIVKGKSGERVIGLTSRALGILKRLALVYPSGSLLRTMLGAEWSPNNIGYTWSQCREKAGLPDTLVSYHCRHDLHRRWSAAGISDLTIAAQLGHKGIGQARLSLLASTYAHVSGEPLAQAALTVEQSVQKPSTRQQRRG